MAIDLKKNIVTSGSIRIVIMALTMIASWISARYLGVELKGKYSYFMTVSGLIWMVIDFGVHRSYPYFVKKQIEKTQYLFLWSLLSFFSELIFLGIIGVLFKGFILKIIGIELSNLYLVLMLFLVTFTKLGMQLQAIHLGVDKVLDYSISQLISAFLVVLMLLTAFLFQFDVDRLFYVLIAVTAAAVVNIVYYFLRNKWHFTTLKSNADTYLSIKAKGFFSSILDFTLIRNVYTSGVRVFVSSLLILLLIRFDIILIKRMLGFKDVGIYSIAAHIIDIMQLAANLVGALLLVKLTETDRLEQKWAIMRKLLIFFSIILLVSNICFVMFGKFLLATLFGLEFVPVYNAFIWLIPASFSLSFGSLFNNYLNSKGFPLVSIILPGIALLINLLLNIILIPRQGIAGAGLATSISYTTWFVSIIVYEHYSTGNKLIQNLIPRLSDFSELWSYALSLIGIGKTR